MNHVKILEENLDFLNLQENEYGLSLDFQETCTPNLRMLQASSGHPVPQVLGQNGNWITLHSLVNPMDEALRFAQTVTCSRNSIVVILGAGMGYHLEQLLRNTQHQPVIIVEREKNILKTLFSTVKLNEWCQGRTVCFLTGEDPEAVVEKISNVQIANSLLPFSIIHHIASVRAYPDFYGIIDARLTNANHVNLGTKLRYKKFFREHLRILILHSKYYLLPEILNSLKKIGHSSKVIMLETDQEGEGSQKVIENIISDILNFKPDFVLTVNHLGFDSEGILTQLFSDIELPYASWYVDSPVFILEDFKKQVSPFLSNFVWDRDYVQDLKSYGFENTFFLPLATDPTVFRLLPFEQNPLQHLKCHVGFVGNSGENIISECIDKMTGNEAVRALLDHLAIQFMNTPKRFIQDINPNLSAEQYQLYEELMEHQRDVFVPAVTWRATQMYRLNCVKQLMDFQPYIHGDSGWHNHVNGQAVLRPELNYYDELPFFYNLCKINFNTTSLQMKQGVNQRVFDVPACGGFLLTDYRAQLEEMFHVGKEAICYSHPGEIKDLVSFYLRHPSQMMNIAANAHERVLKEHTYVRRLEQLTNQMKSIYG